MENEKTKLSEREFRVLYLCDDSLGLIDLITKELDISKEEIKEILDNLIERGIIEKGEHEASEGRWYYPTEFGKKCLKENDIIS